MSLFTYPFYVYKMINPFDVAGKQINYNTISMEEIKIVCRCEFNKIMYDNLQFFCTDSIVSHLIILCLVYIGLCVMT